MLFIAQQVMCQSTVFIMPVQQDPNDSQDLPTAGKIDATLGLAQIDLE